MKIIITGGNGFLGNQVGVCGADAGICSMLAVRGKIPKTKYSNTKYFRITNLENFGSDARDYLDSCTAIVHTAGLVHNDNKYNRAARYDYERVNVAGAVSVAKSAINAGVEKFIFISSAAVYGEAFTPGPATETSMCMPNDLYGWSKLAAEAQLFELFNASQCCTKLIIIRPPVIYGSNCPGNFRMLTKLMKLGIPLPLNSFSNKRSMISDRNLADAIITCIKRGGSYSGVYNIAETKPIALNDLLATISKALASKNKLFSVPHFVLKFGAFLIGKSALFETLSASNVMCTKKFERDFQWSQRYDSSEEITKSAESFL